MTLPLPAPLGALLEVPARALGAGDGPDLTRYLLVCGGLLGLVALMAWLARRLLAGQMRARAAKRSLQVLDLLPMGGKQRLAVVRCYDRTFLLGLGDKEIHVVSELDSVVAPAGPGGATSVEARSFADLLRRSSPRDPKPARVPERTTRRAPAEHAGLDPQGVLG